METWYLLFKTTYPNDPDRYEFCGRTLSREEAMDFWIAGDNDRTAIYSVKVVTDTECRTWCSIYDR